MNFPLQKKILDPLLKNSKNNHCADCNATAPIWASLDFGVFVCSNCSGAHRALGPTVTRIKSATLDLWQQEWVDNMLIGNEVLNLYWEANPLCHEKKSKWDASSKDIHRYVYEKYIKRKYVSDPSQPDPLSLYKMNKNGKNLTTGDSRSQPTETKSQKVESSRRIEREPKNQPKVQTDLLDFEAEASPQNSMQVETSKTVHTTNQHENMINFNLPETQSVQSQNQGYYQHQQGQIQANQHPLSDRNGYQQRQPSQVSEREHEHGTSFTTETSKDNFMSFDQMMTNQTVPGTLQHSVSTQEHHKPNFELPSLRPNPPSLLHQHQHQHHPHHNMVYQQQSNLQVQQHTHHYAQSPQPQTHPSGYPSLPPRWS